MNSYIVIGYTDTDMEPRALAAVDASAWVLYDSGATPEVWTLQVRAEGPARALERATLLLRTEHV